MSHTNKAEDGANSFPSLAIVLMARSWLLVSQYRLRGRSAGFLEQMYYCIDWLRYYLTIGRRKLATLWSPYFAYILVAAARIEMGRTSQGRGDTKIQIRFITILKY